MTTYPDAEFDFEEFLQSNELALVHNVLQHRTFIARTTGSLSTVASVCIIVHILRSHHALTTTYHRLVFGLSIGDIIFSFFAFVLDGSMAPKEMDYIVPFAMGNQATCDAQGFLETFGAAFSSTYNNNICIYYLAIVTFNKKDDYIRKLEPWFHGISILANLAFASMILAINGYNSSGGHCWFYPNELQHCEGIQSGEIRDGFTIPCGRGDRKEHPTLYRALQIFHFSGILLTPVVIIVSMALMYRTVYKVERKMEKYGVSTLRLRNQATRNDHVGNKSANCIDRNSPSGSQPASHDENSRNRSRIFFDKWLKANLGRIPCINTFCSIGHNSPRSNSVKSQKRVILQRAAGYVSAWGLTYIPVFVLLVMATDVPLTMAYIQGFFTPLQGVFNFIAYMLPKVRNVKRGPRRRRRMVTKGGARNGDHVNAINWRQAFVIAYTSRGPKKTSRQQHARMTNTSNGISWGGCVLNVLKKLKTFITPSVSRKKSMNNSNNDVITTNRRQQETRPLRSGQEDYFIRNVDAPAPTQHDNTDEYSESSMRPGDSSISFPPLVLFEADDLKEEGASEEEDEECQLNTSSSADNKGNDLVNVFNDIFYSEEIQSILG